MNKKTQMFSKPAPDGKPMTKPVADGLTEERGYDGHPLAQAVMQDQPQNTGQDVGEQPGSTQDQPQNTGQDAGEQPGSTQGNAVTGATSSQEGAKEQTK